MSERDFDALVIGAGAVGLACAYALARRNLSVAVVEQERRIGAGVSSRNSEVIHAGLYYPTGSLKARLCVEGRRKLYAFLADHHVSYRKCGKLVVATNAEEIEALRRIEGQAKINDVEGVTWLSSDEVRALEPNLRAEAALLSETSGIMDAHGYMDALHGAIEAESGHVVLATPFLAARTRADGGFDVDLGGETPATISTAHLIIAAGLGAQNCARAIEGFPPDRIPKQHFGKGNYFALSGVKPPFQRLIYPPPIAGALGTHYRCDLGGAARFGPDLQWVDHEDYRVDASRAERFYADIRRYWPALPDGALTPDYAGIRPKIHGPNEKQPDFRIDGADAHGLPGLVALFGIESPGLTSSLAIGDYVADMIAPATL